MQIFGATAAGSLADRVAQGLDAPFVRKLMTPVAAPARAGLSKG